MEEIIKRLGNPSKKFLDKITNKKTKKIYDKGGAKQDACFGIKISNPLVKDLINKCLIMEPEQRISAEDALKHKYFKIYHDPEDEPDFEGKIDDSFEHDNELTVNKLRKAVIDEINSVNKRNNEPSTYVFEEKVKICKTNSEQDKEDIVRSTNINKSAVKDKQEFLKGDVKDDIIAKMNPKVLNKPK